MPRFLSSANPAKDYRPAATFAPITRLYLPGPNVCFSLHGHVECVRGSDCTPVAHSFRNVRSTLVAKGKVNSCRVTMEASGRKRSFGDRSICLRLGRGEGDALLAGDNRPFLRTENIFHENVSSWREVDEKRGILARDEERHLGRKVSSISFPFVFTSV